MFSENNLKDTCIDPASSGMQTFDHLIKMANFNNSFYFKNAVKLAIYCYNARSPLCRVYIINLLVANEINFQLVNYSTQLILSWSCADKQNLIDQVLIGQIH